MIELFEAISLFTPFFCLFLYLSNRKLRERLDRVEQLAQIREAPATQSARSAAFSELDASAPAAKDRQAESPWPVRGEADAREAACDAATSPSVAATEIAPSSEASEGSDTALTAKRPAREEKITPEPVGPEFGEVVMGWLRQNWVYAISALSLALAGIFAAQYAADSGMLPPAMRIALAALMGGLFIAGGEVVRRRSGDEGETSTIYLPSVFSGAGIVTLFGAVLTARYLYGMIEAPAALGLLAGVAGLSVALGWFYGPVLAAVGILGATAAPFVVGGEPGTPGLLNAYFGLVALAGLSINALRKWPWIDMLALLAPYGAATLVVLAQPEGAFFFIGHSVLIALAAGIFMGGAFSPRLENPLLTASLLGRTSEGDDQRQTTAAAGWLASVAGLVLAGMFGPAEMVASMAGLTALFLAGASWSRAGVGAADLALTSGAGIFLLSLLEGGLWFGALGGAETGAVQAALGAVTPLQAMIAAAGITAAAAAWRSLAETGRAAQAWICGAAIIGPGLLAAQEALRAPAAELGVMAWASVAMAFAAGATFVAARSAQIDPDDRLRISLSAALAFSMIGMSLFILLTESALTISLAVLLLGCVAFDDRYRLPALGWFAQAGALVLIYRAVADPGIAWANDASYWELVLAYGLPAIPVAAARLLIERPGMAMVRASLEGVLAVLMGTGVCMLISHLARDIAGVQDGMSHWTLGLAASVWLLSAGASLWSATTPGGDDSRGAHMARSLRLVSAAVAGSIAAGALALAVLVANPFLESSEILWGAVGLSSAALAYLMPGAILLGGAVVLRNLDRVWRQIAAGAGGSLTLLYVCLSVAQFWRGNALTMVPMRDGELWSYTVMLIVIGSGLMLSAHARGSRELRLVANGFLLVAIGKVFVVDAPDLEGLVRAASFLVLGLSLAGLAWANRWASERAEEADE